MWVVQVVEKGEKRSPNRSGDSAGTHPVLSYSPFHSLTHIQGGGEVQHSTVWLEKGNYTLMKCLARVSSPKVVCRADSGPSGTRSFNFSRHVRSWARLNNKKKNNNNRIVSYSFAKMKVAKKKIRGFLGVCNNFFRFPFFQIKNAKINVLRQKEQ